MRIGRREAARSFLRMTGVAVSYVAAGAASAWIAPLPNGASAVWLAAGIAFAGALRLGRAGVLGVAVGALVAPLLAGAPLAVAAGASAAMTVSAALGAHWCRRAGFTGAFDSQREVVTFLVWGTAVPELVGSAIGAGTSTAVGWFAPLTPLQVMMYWWAGSSVGTLLVVPVLLIGTHASRAAASWETAVIPAISGLVASVVFWDALAALPLAFLGFPLVMLAATRGGPFGAALSIFAVGVVAIAASAASHGPFAGRSPNDVAALASAYCTALAVSGLALAAALAERVAAERRTTSTEADLAFALSAASMAPYEWDLAAGRGVLGAAIAPSFGLPAERTELDRERLVELIHPDDRAFVESRMRLAHSDPGHGFEIEHRTAIPVPSRWVYVKGVIGNDDAGRLRARGVILDVTERKALEEQFRQAQKMETVGRLAGGIAHDFNNLLTVILGETELLLAADGAGWRESTLQIRAAGERARELTRQLLAFARRQVVQPSVFRLDAQVRELAPLLGRVLGEEVELAVHLDADPWTVRADPNQLEQVLMNLAINARDAMSSGGKLSIATQRHHGMGPVPADGARDWLVVQVRDTGSGIEPAVLEHVFEPFFTTKVSGTGLGLSTCFGLVQQMGGEIFAASTPGAGSEFTIWLPRSEAPEDAPATAPAAPPGAISGARVLVVEDQPAVRELACRALERQGYVVSSACNGTDALRLADAGEPIDLVLMDVLLPDLDGREVARRLRERRPGLRVLFVSGFSNRLLERGDSLAPGVALLEKPYTIQQLLEKVREQLVAT